MKKISKIIMCIMSTAVIVFLLPLSAIAGYSSWKQTSDSDFASGTPTNVDTTTVLGTIRLKTSSWQETTTTHFNTGVTKTNIDTASNELKLLTRGSETINQQQTKSEGWSNWVNVFGEAQAYAQSFKPSIDCILTKVSIYAKRFGNPGNWTLSLRADNNNSPGTVLASTSFSVGTTGSWIDVNLSDTNLTANTRYWLYVPGKNDWNNGWGWGWCGKDPYPNNDVWTYSPHYGGELHSYFDMCFKIYERHWTTGHFRSQEKDLGTEVAFNNFYASALSGQSYTYKVRRYSAGSWSNWVTVTSGNKINLSNGTKVQYDIVLTSNDGTNPKVYDVTIQAKASAGTYTSPVKDLTVTPDGWGRFEANYTLNNGNIDFYIGSSSYTVAGSLPSETPWYPVRNGEVPSCLLNRYVQWRADFSITEATQDPVLDEVTIVYNPYPDEPTLTAPGNGDWTKDNKPLFEWDFNDDCPGAMQAGFRVVIDDKNTFTGINYDSGEQNSSVSQYQFPSPLPDDVWYWKCCTKNNYGLWGEYSDYSVLKIDTTPPDIPVMKTEPEVTAGDENQVSWYPAGDGDGRGGVEYYVQCSSDSGFAWVTALSEGWITKEFCNFTGLRDGVTYYYRVRAQDALVNQSEYSRPVWSRQDDPVITDYYASPDPFSPNDDGLKDATTIYYTLSRGCIVTIKIYDSDDIPKITLIDGLSKSQGPNWVIWDGKDKDGKIVPNGTYIYEITAEDQMSNIRHKEGKVRVENLVTIESRIPEDNGYLVISPEKEEEIEITFNRHMSTSTMTLGISIIDEDGNDITEWEIVYVSSVTTMITELELKYCTEYTVKVSQDVTDILGNRLTNEESFSFVTLMPEGLKGTITVEHKAGKVTIKDPSDTFPGEGKGWYINLVEKDIRPRNYVEETERKLICYGVDYSSDNPKEIDKEIDYIDELNSPVTISIPYHPRDIKDKRNLRLYFYNNDAGRWELVKGSGDKNPDDGKYLVTGEVWITNTEYCVRGFAMGGLIGDYSNYPNPFKAGKEKTTIEYDLEEDAKVTISIYDLLGQLVRRIKILKGTPGRGERGPNTVPWYGKNERGRVVANGGYYCVVEANTETGKHMKKVRKIMVIK